MKRNPVLDKVICVLLAAVIAAGSAFVVRPRLTGSANSAAMTAKIDENIQTVLDLTAAATVTSTVISMMPDDTATPVAEKLADFSGYFLIVLCVLYLEKYLLAILGTAGFGVLIPLACLVWVIGMFYKGHGLRPLALRIAAFGLVAALVIPAGLTVSDMVYAAYEDSISETIDAAAELAEDAEDAQAAEDAADANGTEDVSGWWSKLAEKGTSLVSTAEGLKDRAAGILNRFLQALAVVIVTTCLIPVLVAVMLIYAAKLLLNVRPADFPVWSLRNADAS